MDRNDQFIKRTLDNDLSDATLVDTGVQIIPDLVVFDQFFRIFVLLANQLLSQPRMIPNLKPVGFVF